MMGLIRNVFISTFWLSTLQVACAQDITIALDSERNDLNALIRASASQYIDKEIDMQRIDIANSRIDLAKSSRAPKISLDTQLSPSSTLRDSRVDNLFSRNIGLNGSKTLYSFGRNKASLNRAEANLKQELISAQVNEHASTIESLRLLTELAASNEILDIRSRSVEILQQQYRNSELRNDLGIDTLTSLSRARAQLSIAKAAQIDARNSIFEFQSELSYLIGYDPPDVSLLVISQPINLPESINEILPFLRNDNPLVQKSRVKLEYVEAQKEEVSHLYSPNLSLRASAFQRSQSTIVGNDNALGLTGGLSFNLPLTSGGEGKARRKVAAAETRIAEIELNRALREETIRLRAQWNSYLGAVEELIFVEAAVDAARLALRGSTKEVEIGSLSLLEALESEQQLLNSSLRRVSARKEVVSRVVTMFEIMGKNPEY